MTPTEPQPVPDPEPEPTPDEDTGHEDELPVVPDQVEDTANL